MFRILNMNDQKGKKILKEIIVNPKLNRNNIEKELSKNIKTKVERLEEIEKEQSKNRKNKETTYNKIKKNVMQQQKFHHKKFQSPKEQQ